MLNSEQLDKMGRMAINRIDKSDLADIQSVGIDTSLPSIERMQNYLAQIKNPYCFMCGGTPVQISFKSEDKGLDGLLENYFLGLKNS